MSFLWSCLPSWSNSLSTWCDNHLDQIEAIHILPAMIQRFCFAKLSDAEVPARAAIARALRVELAEAGAHALVGLPADGSAAKWDLSIVITSPSLEAWTLLSQTPKLIALLRQLAERSAVVKEWTFVVEN